MAEPLLPNKVAHLYLKRSHVRMEPIQKRFLMDEHNPPDAVQLDLATFEKIETVLEDYALYQFMQEDENDAPLSLKEAQAYYGTLPKAE